MDESLKLANELLLFSFQCDRFAQFGFRIHTLCYPSTAQTISLTFPTFRSVVCAALSSSFIVIERAADLRRATTTKTNDHFK